MTAGESCRVGLYQPGASELINKQPGAVRRSLTSPAGIHSCQAGCHQSQGHHYIYIAYIPRIPYNVSLRTQGLRLLAVLLTGGSVLLLVGKVSYYSTLETTHNDK